MAVGGTVSWAEGAARDHIKEASIVFIPAHSVFGKKNYSTSHNTPEKVAERGQPATSDHTRSSVRFSRPADMIWAKRKSRTRLESGRSKGKTKLCVSQIPLLETELS